MFFKVIRAFLSGEIMKREDRFLVLKESDVMKYTNELHQLILSTAINAIVEGRKAEGRRINSYVVVADDWPEYEEVWKMIEKRVDNEDSIHS